jgi:hypothetical protein
VVLNPTSTRIRQHRPAGKHKHDYQEQYRARLAKAFTYRAVRVGLAAPASPSLILTDY